MNETQVKNFQNGKKIALFLGGAVYAGVVLLFLAFYEKLMMNQFTGTLQVFARIGAFLVSANAIALPVALHYWTVTKYHRIAGVIFYAGDIIIMGLNVLASAQIGNIPEWIRAYQAYAPASIIYVLAGWAILFMTDPGQRALVSLSEAITEAQVSIVKRVSEFVGSDDGIQKIVTPFAGKLAGRVFNERTLIGSNQGLPSVGSDLNLDQVVAQVLAKMNSRSANTPGEPPKTPEQSANTPGEIANASPTPAGVPQGSPFPPVIPASPNGGKPSQ